MNKTKKLIKKFKTIPNIITLSRVPLGILILIFFLIKHYKLAFVLYVLAVLTDALDGISARKLKQETEFGTFLASLVARFFIILLLTGLIIAGKFTLLLKTIIVFWVIGEGVIGLLITWKYKKFYLSITHRNSIRYTTLFIYITIGSIIIDFKYILIPIGLTIILGLYAVLDYSYLIYKKEIKSKS